MGSEPEDPQLDSPRGLVRSQADGDGEPEAAGRPGWWAYVLVSESGGRTYVGVSSSPARRLDQHNGRLAGGARSTRAGRPWSLGALFGPFESRGEAQRAEARLRRLRGRDRLAPPKGLERARVDPARLAAIGAAGGAPRRA